MTDPSQANRARLYMGRTTHLRTAPREHRFSYGVFQILVDVDQLAEAFAGLKTIRHGRLGLFSFAERDHGARDGSSLRPWVEATLNQAGLDVPTTRISLLCFPRVLGFVFNPISLFYIYGPNDVLKAVLYEVNNTFGQTHAYVVPTEGLEVEHHEADKCLYVSPFYRVEGGYRFTVTPPGDRLSLTILKQVGGEVDFTASLIARREALTDAALIKLLFAMPLMTLGVVAAIHWEAVRLWFKGAIFGARPAGPKAGVSLGQATHRSL